jgi:hypothetical protein
MKNKRLVKLKDCPIGLFIKGNTLCVKTEYGNDDAYIVWSGGRFWGGAKTIEEIGEILVLPISDKVVQRLERKYGRKYKTKGE